MLRRALALLLVLSWLVLAGIDLLEDLNGHSQVALNSHSQSGGLANDIVESADAACVEDNSSLSEQATCFLSVSLPPSSPRASKLHKLHQIYQI
jgi:hypothetical protein